jgi:hypothetical protein
VRPDGWLANDRFTLRGNTVTDRVDDRPVESTTVRVMRYRVLPLKS